MVSTLKKYTISLHGVSYTIVSDEPEFLITQAISLVEQKALAISKMSPTTVDFQKILALSAVEIARDYLRTQHQVEEIAGKQSQLVSHIENEVGL